MHYEERFGGKELKFLVTPALAAAIREWARQNLEADPHAASGGDRYRVTSLYFDTAGLDVYNRRGSYARAKYRVRRYDQAPTVFVERKLKTESVVTKRRSLIPIDEVSALLSGRGGDRGWAGRWFDRRLCARSLRPVCAISYLRTARVAESGGSLIRLTLDEDLRAVPVAGGATLPADAATGMEINTGRQILELKFRGSMPPLFKQLLETFPLHRSTVSKYRTAAAALHLADSHA